MTVHAEEKYTGSVFGIFLQQTSANINTNNNEHEPEHEPKHESVGSISEPSTSVCAALLTPNN